MRIGIDGTGIQKFEDGSTSGVITYTIQIVKNLLEIDDRNSYYIYCFNEIPESIKKRSSQVRYKVFKRWNRKIWQQFALPIVALIDNLELIFFPGNAASLFVHCKAVATIHDLHPYVIRDSFKKVHSQEIYGSQIRSLINKIYWNQMMRVLSKKDRVIAVSQATKRDVQKYFKTSAERIDVVHEGVNLNKFSSSRDVADLEWFREKYQLPGSYILCVGTHGYKNLNGSLRAFHIVKQRTRNHIKLVIAGSKRSVRNEIFKLVEQLELEDDVIFTGFFPDEHLNYLYRCAELLLFPSFYEGFGLPVLEAFASGIPVVSSKMGSLPEVGGKAALLVDPNNYEEIASAVIRILNDKSFRENKRQEGLEQVNKFSWEGAARSTLEVFKKLQFEK